METIETIRRNNMACAGLSEAQDDLMRQILNCVGDTWAMWTLHVLGEAGTLRFSRIMERVEGISQKMLTKTLRQLERDGFITRTMFLEVPPRVEYALTDMGHQLIAQYSPLWIWGCNNIHRFENARADFDARARRAE
jgi:DNA-binding HxlR family transcriptional regulator